MAKYPRLVFDVQSELRATVGGNTWNRPIEKRNEYPGHFHVTVAVFDPDPEEGALLFELDGRSDYVRSMLQSALDMIDMIDKSYADEKKETK